MLRRHILLALLVASLGGGAWLWWRAPVRVSVAAVTRGPAIEAVYATGTVEPLHWARVGPAPRGRLTAVLVAEGERVSEGQVLARLDDRQARALAEEAEARARFAEEDLARTRALVARDIAARAQLERAERDARAARAAADAARQRLDEYVVRAPADGVVLRLDAEVGEVVDTTAALFWIGEPRPLRVTAEVDEEDIPRIAPGQRALLRADAFRGRVLEGQVAHITPKGDTTRKAFRVRLALPDDTPLMIGMTVEANIILREDPAALLLPSTALLLEPADPSRRERTGRVFVLQEGRLAAREVRLGVIGPRHAEVLAGLAEGELVVTDPRPALRAGQRARMRRTGGAG
ncbi:MAG: efflux RND transporter periplasmic adaptor subunit [Rhodovarius sp.]|nr:efflux RND transporter periplasmic adaptor subunit [Rhodovarius sp.]